jgi:transposase
MARAYSLDLRERVVAAVAAGESCRAVATKFKVSVASVVKWSQRFRANASAAAYKVGGRRPYALAGERDWLLARLADKPDITLRALGAELAARGIKVSHFAVWHFFEHEGIERAASRAHAAQSAHLPGGHRAVQGAGVRASGGAVAHNTLPRLRPSARRLRQRAARRTSPSENVR